ncbi:MAG TPA: beta-ketoacyl synthase chain length factor, partial [Gammaproteobacteria bacterium]|nr:beta-ketoacyl synthase chain length factor [Gammaproteobacteria bacterium]
MNPVRILGAGVTAPGLPDWPSGRAVLAGQRAPAAEPLAPFRPDFLPRNERRRTTRTIKLALQVAQQAAGERPGRDPELATVFASSCGDTEVAVAICRSLAQPGRPVSPIQFHNSVHNAAAGYWSIGWGSPAPSVSLGAYDGSVGAGLLEATTQVLADGRQVLLVAYDLPPPPPLDAIRPLASPFAAALLLGPGGDEPGLGTVAPGGIAAGEQSACAGTELEALRRGNPAAR